MFNTVQNGPLYSLASVGPLLACGGCEDIKLWRWEELISSTKDSQPVHVLTSQTGWVYIRMYSVCFK